MHESIRILVRRAAAEQGGRTAIECGDASLTYGELEARANALTDKLLNHGLERGSVVGLLIPDSTRLVTAILGVLEAGGIFMPLDPRAPAKRLAAMVAEAGPRLFLIDRDLAALVPEIAPDSDARVLVLDDEAEDAGGPALERPDLGGDDPCYIYFTSGSTGRPKGVTGRLKGIDHFIRWEIETFDLGYGPRVSQLTALSFDAFLRDAFVPLCSGGTLCVPPDREILSDAGKLVDWIDRQRIELVHCVPSLLRTLLAADLTPERFASLRRVLLAGEPLLPADVRRWTDLFGSRIELVNLYGPSETTMVKFFYRVPPEDAQRRTIPIGKPMRGARGLILDGRNKPRPAGAIGEIFIRTPYRSLGYYNRPEETSQVFLPNPMSEDPNDLLYRTGDLGRVLEDGNFEFMGRKDQQVKIRGVRVELEEIEGLLSQHEAVREAAVVEQQDRTGSLFLAAFVVLRPGCDVAVLRNYLAAHLPDVMVPSRFIAVDELPRSINGKIDRRGLRTLAEERSGAEREHVAPRSELETMLAGLFSQLLGVERVGVIDNFFQLGGHSLLATQLVARVRSSLALEVPLRSLLQNPTVEGLAREIEALRANVAEPAGAPPPLVPVPRGGDLPLSFAQQRLWFINELEPGSPAYNMPFGLRLRGPLDIGALRGTFGEIVRRHESLRTVFTSEGGVPRQIVLPEGPADLPVVDLSVLPAAAREAHLTAEVTAAFWRPFDLERGPLVRGELLKLAEDEHALVFCMHHIVSDAWSVRVLVREVAALYAGSPLPPLPLQYADFAHWQRSWLQGEVLERQIRYWKERLAGAEPLALPIDRSAALRRPVRGVQWLTLSPELTPRLKELGSGSGATLFMVVLAALKALLFRVTGQLDTSVGMPIANRTRVELEGLIGFFVNTLVLRTRTTAEATFRDLLTEVRDAAVEAQTHQDLPFEKLIEELDPERSLDQTPLFRVMFDLAVDPPQEIGLPGLKAEPLAFGGGGEAKFDLLLNLRERDGLVDGVFEYRSTLFEPTTVQRLAAWLVSILDAAVAEPGRRLSEVPMLSAAEVHQVLVERNEDREGAKSEAEGLFPEVFAARARRTPEAAALVFEDRGVEGSVTYGELADRAGRLARYLSGLGVGPGTLVAVCMDRSPFLIEGILGVLQAGGAYVPVEPDLPRERVDFLLEASGAGVLITRESLLPLLPDLLPVVCLDRDAERIAAASAEATAIALSPHDSAYVMFTSGSTGRPKGVVVPHRALAWFVRTAGDQYALGPADRMLQVSSIGFDVSVEEIFPSLATGATLCLCSDPLLRSPAFVFDRCRRWRITALSVPTAFWHVLVDEIAGGRGEEIPESLRLLVIGGEPASPARAAEWRSRGGSAVRLINSYGPTETTVAATSWDVREPAPGTELWPLPIGRPLRGAEVYVLDAALQPVAGGVPGELFLGGGGCSRGYLDRPDLTAERFVPHPFATRPGERLYRTGDLARELPDGNLDFLGRTDRQVKVRGFRIEPGEVDAVLAGHPQVQSSVTVVWEPAPGDRRLVTYFVAPPGEAPRLSALRGFLQSRLPAYLVPSALEPLAAIPMTPNGKVDRRALPAPQGARAAAESYVAPSGPVEEALAAIWAEVLRLDRVGVHDDFFALGGHSLLGTQMVSRVREALGVELPLRRLFEAPTIHQLALSLREAPAVSPLSSSELEQVLRASDGPRSGFPREASLPELFAQVAREMPEAPAVVGADGEVWSYRRLGDEAGRLARRLRSLGVGSETAVGVALERSPGLIAGLLAILQAGGAYVPLDPAYPDERLSFLLEDTGARLVLVDARSHERLAALSPPAEGERTFLLVDSVSGEGEAGGAMPDGGERLAYVLYTSGSTGQPKGVAVSHRSIVRLVRESDYVRLGPGDRVAHLSNTSFDAATFEIWGALLNGAAVVVVPRDAALEPVELAALLRRERVTALFLTTALFNQMIQQAPDAFATVRHLLFGGEAADPRAVARALEQAGPERLLHVYGPTESTTFATWHQVGQVPPGAATVPIGQPLANTSAFVLDRHLRPVPSGAAGELFLGGYGLARGYLNRPELTAERFVPHLWGDGERLYRTGDLARRDGDGLLEFLGRIDSQVKVRGHRIEPGEIEAVLRTHPEVREAAVLPVEDSDGRRLVAWVAPENAEPGLREWLATRLPEYMLPAAVVGLDSLPLTPNGKVDRRALALPQGRPGGGEGYVSPSDPVETALAEIWAEVLRLDRVGIHDDFFALGGHSLLATQAVSRAREALGVDFPLRRLFENPTVHQLARVLREAPLAAPGSAVLAAADEGSAPLSFAQQRLWFLDQLEPGNPAYNIPSAVRLRGDLSVDALERTFTKVVRRHQVLRTTFPLQGGQPVQAVAPPESARPELRLLDLSGAPEEMRDEWALDMAVEEARQPFDLRNGPLLRLGLLRLGEREHLLLVTMHHIVSDGWSMGVLLREVGALYPAFLRGEASPLPELPLQYADFARWQRAWLQGEVLERQLTFWKGKLAGAPALLELPTDRPRPAVPAYDGGVVDLPLAPSLAATLREVCRREEATPFMVLLTAWALVLGRHAGQEDVLVGSPIAGRNRREIEDLIGFFVNTLVLRAEWTGAPAFSKLLEQVRETALDAFAHQDLPFERLVEELGVRRDLAVSPLFQVFFSLQNAPAGKLQLPDLALEQVHPDTGMTKFDLSLGLAETAGGLLGALEYRKDLFDAGTAERLAARFAALLEAAAGDPGRSIADLPLMLEAERRQLLAWNETGEAPASGLRLHDRFADQAARTPGAVALRHGSDRVTYAELAGRAGGIAHRLRALGLGRETRVAICLERSPDLIAALLGTLVAGAVYVPIDPAYPAERRAFLLEDSGAAVLVTRGRLLGDLPAPSQVLDLDREAIPAAALPRDGATPDHLAYVIYTSGSTGRPKGVAIEHRSAVALLEWARGEFSDDELSGVLAATSVCFDLSVFEIFVPLSFGGTVILAENALELPSLPAAPEVRLLNTVPSAAAELVRMGGMPLSVRTVCLAGEPLPGAFVDRLHVTGLVERVLNLYGPSEDTTYSTGAVIPRGGERAPSIGRPVRGTRAWVVDLQGNLVPPGVVGELWLAGAGLARGYLARPDLTAERFTPDPFGESGARVYRTGDLVRLRPDGELDFLGRIDHQVKIRGFRVEPGEVEAILSHHSEVAECVVLARQDTPGDRRLVAYVALNPKSEIQNPKSALSAWLRDKLPEHLVPSAFVILGALPRTPNGKVDRRALPEPERRLDESVYVPPADAVEETLAEIWREVLRLERVGVHDNFFTSGGHSLLATQVVTRVRELTGVELPLRRIFEAPTIRQLSHTLREAQPTVEV